MPDAFYDNGERYDRIFPMTDDLPFWLNQAHRAGGSVLELACGTGRVALPLARAGVAVTGIDLAPAMLQTARAHAVAEKLDIKFIKADIRDFDLGAMFPLVIFPANAICHLLDRESVERCFACVRRHLAPGGRFIIAVFVPDMRILMQDREGRFPFGTYEDARGQVEVTHNNIYHPDTQINRITLYYRRAGESAETTEPLTMRMFFPAELEALLYYNGFRVEQRFGDFDGAPFGPDSPQQITVALARDNLS